jgi:ribosome-binding ATPase
MRLGIIGLPQSGKTTIFNALTRGDQPVTMSGGRIEIRTAVVDVPDARVDRLVELFHPQKMAYAKVTYADIAGLEGNSGKNAGNNGGNLANDKKGISGQLLNQLSQMDGFVHVVRCFENPTVAHPAGSIDAQRDILAMDSELAINDLISVERRLERLAEEKKKNGGRDKALIEREMALFERFQAALSDGNPLREIDLDVEQEKMLSGFGLLTLKPLLIVLNLAEEQTPPQVEYHHRFSAVVPLQGRLEMELAQLPAADAALFMEDFGIQELGLQRVINLSYDLLGLQSFFTVGEDEVRAWTVRRGAGAWEAAGAIHSDLQKGFIRAEVIDYRELLELGGLVEARTRGKLRLEGKDYTIQDGEIVHVRFSL